MRVSKRVSPDHALKMESKLQRNPRHLVSVIALALALLMACNVFLATEAPSAYAAPTSAEKQAEVDAVAAQLNTWQTQLEEASNNYYTALEAHDQALTNMEEAQSRIDAAQVTISSTQEKLGTRANSMYKSGPLSFLDVLFGASSFEDFSSRWTLLSDINQENADLIAQNKAAKKEAEDAHAEYTKQEKVAADKLVEAEAIKADAEQIVASYEAELSGLEAEVAELVRQEQEAQRAREQSTPPNSSGGGDAPVYTNPGASVPAGGYGSVVEAAYSRLGCPYVWAASGPDSFDCSGLTSWCYSQAGLGYIGRTDSSQYANAAARLPLSQAQPGDVLWWRGHVGIYIGGGSYIHAPTPGQVVSISSWNIGSAVVLRF